MKSLHLIAIAVAACLLGAAAPAQQIYSIDAQASRVSAKVSFFAIGSKTAGFPEVTGTAKIDRANPHGLQLDVKIDARALTAGDSVTLRRLKSQKFFWVEKYPEVRFVGREMELTSPSAGRVTGDLTARGVTRPVVLDVTFDHPPEQALPGQAITLIGETRIDRYAYGMKSYRLIVGKWVNIQLKARMVPQP